MKPREGLSVLSLFTGAGGLDIGFELEGFSHLEAVEINPWAVTTLRANRPAWRVIEGDVRGYSPSLSLRPDVLLAGFPCQGFSLGGLRDAGDYRNNLYQEVIRVARASKPRVVVLENVLNLRTMVSPETGRPFADQIAHDLSTLGYDVRYDVFRVCDYGVPQTRRRFVFVGFLGGAPRGYGLPRPSKTATIRRALYDLAQKNNVQLPNHEPSWGFRSAVHIETGVTFDPCDEVLPVRFSRTASDGNPIRSFDAPFPAVDTATVWGWAQGNVSAQRHEKDRTTEKFIRNPDATVTLWRVSASRLRTFTAREYARLQTFPDEWVFHGQNKRDIHLQIGNAVPVNFAAKIARNVRIALEAMSRGGRFSDEQAEQPVLFA